MSETLYFTAEKYFSDLKRDIANAKTSIEAEVYIFADDACGAAMEEALANAVKRGVKVRLLVDGIGSITWIRARSQSLSRRGVEVRVFHAVHWRWLSQFSPSGLFYFLSKMNSRNHRKCIVIDGTAAYVGSMNFTDDAYAWRESGVRVEGETAVTIQKIFYATWRFSQAGFIRSIPKRFAHLFQRIKTEETVRANLFTPLRRYFRKNLIRRIHRAKKRVWFITPYFVPPATLLLSLRHSAKRGADVRLVLPGKSDIMYFPWLQKLFYHYLLKAGVRIYEYQPRILHAKSTLIDAWGTVGSSNLNHRSFFRDLELDVVLKEAMNVVALEKQFLQDFSDSLEIDLKTFRRTSIVKEAFARFLLFIKSWL